MSRWVPLFPPDNPSAASAWDAVDAIVHSIAEDETVVARREGRREHARHEDALLFAYLAAARDDVAWAERASDRLNEAIEIAASASSTRQLALYGGVAGLGWTVEHLTRFFDEKFPSEDPGEIDAGEDLDGDGDPSKDINVAIAEQLSRTRPGEWAQQYDLISGLVGYGVYLLERWPRPGAIESLTRVLDHLEALAEELPHGRAWHTSPELIGPWNRPRSPNGHYNLGVAHGVPAILYLLGELIAADIERVRAERLLDGAVAWLSAQQRPAGSVSCFSSWVPAPDDDVSRLAWCYGDLGIAGVLLHVARRAGRDDWSRFAHRLFDHCLVWPEESTRVGDAPLCHGATGVAHIFNRAYQDEGDPRYRDAALLWFDRALAMRRPGSGVGGFSALMRPDPTGPFMWETEPAFLDGGIGIALALLAALTPVEPRWDRLLLLSGRS